jgi:polyribonucleotide nucleotidyltransferase
LGKIDEKMNVVTKNIILPDGREITIETGKLAKQADGAVVVKMGKTMLLATVVAKVDVMPGVDFMPLSVDYQEKFASSGKIPGGFLKRESRLSDYEILISRLVDRALRPMFPDDYHADTQVAISLISHGDDELPDALAALAASAALAVSDIPFNGPISECRVARIGGEFVVNPKATALALADIDIIVAATEDNILMVEGEMLEVSEEDMMQAMKIAHEEIKKHCRVQKELTIAVGKTEKRSYNHEEADDLELKNFVYKTFAAQLDAVVGKYLTSKSDRSAQLNQFGDEYIASQAENENFNKGLFKKYYSSLKKKVVRDHVLDKRLRLDGRKLDQIRPIWSEVNYLPGAHGSAVFTRGETQSLTTLTIGTKLDEKMVDGAVISGTDKFMLHYNFPGFSTGEVKPNRGPGRREVGHGNLALRALKPVVVASGENPFTIRIVSDILESNGSSSMATVCAGTLALMDAGIQISGPVSGIAMGLISDAETGKWAVLSDILGDEDHLGDMDFKVTGTSKGITACQMDIKVDGLSYDILSSALAQAKQGRAHILGEMLKTIAIPNPEFKAHVPRIEVIKIAKDFIGAIIGPGGKIIQKMQADTGCTITIEEKGDIGEVIIFGPTKEAINAALSNIKGIVAVPEVGDEYDAVVKSIMPYGAFVEFLPGKQGLLHVSEVSHERIEDVATVLKEGEKIKVKLIGVDPKTGKFKLSSKVFLPKPEKNTAE